MMVKVPLAVDQRFDADGAYRFGRRIQAGPPPPAALALPVRREAAATVPSLKKSRRGRRTVRLEFLANGLRMFPPSPNRLIQLRRLARPTTPSSTYLYVHNPVPAKEIRRLASYFGVTCSAAHLVSLSHLTIDYDPLPLGGEGGRDGAFARRAWEGWSPRGVQRSKEGGGQAPP